MVYSLDDTKVQSAHRTQYFSMFANRTIYNDGSVVVTRPPVLPWLMASNAPPVEDDTWELHHVDKDFSEANDLAAKEPKKLHELLAGVILTVQGSALAVEPCEALTQQVLLNLSHSVARKFVDQTHGFR
jgi:arylsulfatase A-like enzyme